MCFAIIIFFNIIVCLIINILHFRTKRRNNIIAFAFLLLEPFMKMSLLFYQNLIIVAEEDLPVDTARYEKKRKTATIMEEPGEEQRHGRGYGGE